MKEKIKALLAGQPDITQAQAAVKLGVSRQRINAVCKRDGIVLTKGTTLPRLRPPGSTNHFGVISYKPNSSFIGAAAELIVAGDLMRRGIPVYRALAAVAAFDLVANVYGTLVRVEVRTGKPNSSGRLICNPPTRGRYDVLAVVTPTGGIEYRPNANVPWLVD